VELQERLATAEAEFKRVLEIKARAETAASEALTQAVKLQGQIELLKELIGV